MAEVGVLSSAVVVVALVVVVTVVDDGRGRVVVKGSCVVGNCLALPILT